MAERRILEGLVVVDFTRVVAGPYATRMLADMGADVVKIDPPSGLAASGVDGMPARGGPRRAAGSVENNLGKRSVILDLKDPTGFAVARDLLATADVLVENFSPGVMGRFGLGWEAVHELNPRLVFASISGFGHNNSFSHRRAFGATAHAEAGWIWAQQRAARTEAPFPPGVTVADLITGSLSFSGILAALLDRERTGLGQHVDTSLMDGQLALLNDVASGARNGNTEENWSSFRHPIHQAQDGHLTINVGTPRHFGRIAAGLGHEGAAIPATGSEANALVSSWVAEHTVESATRGLDAAGAAYGEVKTMPDAVQHPYFEERGMMVDVDDVVDGTHHGISSALFLSDTESAPTGRAPLAGEHSREVLTGLGYDEAKIEALLAGPVSQHPPLE
jgi:crotonobetainyl-CoA:carnitine CoA-transferase CaiB-like acyl-CoA transferase